MTHYNIIFLVRTYIRTYEYFSWPRVTNLLYVRKNRTVKEVLLITGIPTSKWWRWLFCAGSLWLVTLLRRSKAHARTAQHYVPSGANYLFLITEQFSKKHLKKAGPIIFDSGNRRRSLSLYPHPNYGFDTEGWHRLSAGTGNHPAWATFWVHVEPTA